MMEMFFIQLFSCNLSSLAIKNNYRSRMKEMFFEDDIDDSKYCGHLYGLGTNFVVGTNSNSLTTSRMFLINDA